MRSTASSSSSRASVASRCLLTCLLACLLTCLLAYLLTYLLAYLLTYLLILLTYLLTCLRSYLSCCGVQVHARAGDAPQEIASLGPGDFFGETGLIEGRATRNTDVVCKTPVSVLMISNAMFLQLTSASYAGSAGAAIAARMRERAEVSQSVSQSASQSVSQTARSPRSWSK